MIKKILKIFKRKKLIHIEVGRCGVIVSTEPSLEAGINDKFNKKIVIYKKVSVKGYKEDPIIRWGKPIEEIPYTEEEVKNLIEIKEIPIVPKEYKEEFEFKEGPPFGEILE